MLLGYIVGSKAVIRHLSGIHCFLLVISDPTFPFFFFQRLCLF